MPNRLSTSDVLRRAAGDRLRGLLPSKPVSRGRTPSLAEVATGPLFGNGTVGRDLVDGRWTHGGQAIDVGAQGHPFAISLPSERFARWVHSFAWLPDLLSAKDGAAKAAELLGHWVAQFPARPVNPFVYGADLLAERVFHLGWLLSAVEPAPGPLTDSYAQQMRRLRAVQGELGPGLPELYSHAAGVIFGARQTERANSWLDRGLDRLDAALGEQVLPDGGHVSRSPTQTVEALRIALVTDHVLSSRNLSGSKALTRAIDRLGPMIETLRHTDGGLAVFHGSGEGSAERIAALLAAAPGEAAPFAYGPHTGYHRLSAGESVLIVDTHGVAPRPHDTDAHLAPLAMELSTAEGRLIVNCGWHAGGSPNWRRPVRSAAAHSTLILNEQSPGDILESGLAYRTLGAAISRDPGEVRARRKEQASGIWLESAHDGYRDAFGLVHRRRLFMGEDGDDIRGEDSLFVPVGDTPLRSDTIPYTIRFHFHPDVRVSLAQDLSSALLVQRGRAGWRFRTDGGPLAVEPSVYLGASPKPVRAQQLVIRGNAYGDGDGQGRDNRVRWSLRRLRARRPGMDDDT